jgi:hypothetical protein
MVRASRIPLDTRCCTKGTLSFLDWIRAAEAMSEFRRLSEISRRARPLRVTGGWVFILVSQISVIEAKVIYNSSSFLVNNAAAASYSDILIHKKTINVHDALTKNGT